MWCSQFLQHTMLLVTMIITSVKSDEYKALPTIIQTPVEKYSHLLNHSILFYEAQRSGKLPQNNRISWRHDSALNDGSQVNIDLSGGYYDAGDYLKFTFPLAYSLFVLSWGGFDYYEGYKLANQSTYLRDQIKWGTDWLIKAHPEPSTLFVQVGDESLDHSYYGSDFGIKLPRPCYQINETYFGTDVAAMTAAALASSARFFSITNNPEDLKYASMLAQHAIQLYNASVSILPYRSYQASVPSVLHTYASSDYTDDLVLASLLLYKITKDKLYIDNAHYFYNGGLGLGGRTQPLGWDNKYGAVYVLFSEIMLEIGDEYELFMKRVDAEKYLDGIVDGTSVNRTQSGLLWWNDFSTVNSNANALSTSLLLVSYSTNVLKKIVGSSDNKEALLSKVRKYEVLANSQLNYILGKNPLNQNYIVGEGPESPRFPHSALTNSGPSINPNSTDIPFPNVLYGALVGGPSGNDSYNDSHLNWQQNEVALDYNAPYQSLLAYKIMYDMSDSVDEPNSPLPKNRNRDDNESGQKTLPKWVLPVAVTLSVLAFIAITALVWKLYSRRKIHARNKGVMTATNDVSSNQLGNGSPQSLQLSLSFGSTLRG